MKKKVAWSLKNIAFPRCSDLCRTIKYLGVGECESICPWKFEKKDIKLFICESLDNKKGGRR